MTDEHLLPDTVRERARGCRLIAAWPNSDEPGNSYDGLSFASLDDMLRFAHNLRTHGYNGPDTVDLSIYWFRSWADAEAWLDTPPELWIWTPP